MKTKLLKRLRRLDACAVSDALDRLGKAGGVTGLVRLAGGGKITGKVLTVTLGPGAPPLGPARHLCARAIEAAEMGDVIVVEHRSGVVCGGWGGLLSLGAKARGVAGVIVEGYARDIEDCRAADFPVFARAVTMRTARGRIVERAFNEPITVGDVRVEAGDFVVADGSGAVFVAVAEIERVLDEAERIAGREAAMSKAILAGKPIGEVMGADYEHMLSEQE
jgi:4-hydroxy-4-methyl-2-oxoglutarate aldolase